MRWVTDNRLSTVLFSVLINVICGKSQESRFDFCNLMVIFGSIWRINNWRSLLNWIEFDEGGSAAQRGFMTILSTWYNPNLSKRRFSTRWHLEMENLQAFPLNPQIEEIHNHHQNCFHHHNQKVDCLTGRLDDFRCCFKLSIAATAAVMFSKSTCCSKKEKKKFHHHHFLHHHPPKNEQWIVWRADLIILGVASSCP